MPTLLVGVATLVTPAAPVMPAVVAFSLFTKPSRLATKVGLAEP